MVRILVLVRFILGLFAIAFFPAIAMSEEDGLYDAPPPDDAAYIRFIGFNDTSEVSAFGFVFDDDRLTSGHYNILHADTVEGLDAGDIFTVVPGLQGAPVFNQEPERSRRKILLRLVNLGYADDVALKTADGAVEIIGPTGSDSLGVREVNPVRIELNVFVADDAIAAPIVLTLRPGEHLTIVVESDGGVTLLEDQAIPVPMK